MKNKTKQILFLLLVFTFFSSKAQSWQWAKQGGSTFNMAGLPAPPEEIYSMDVDNEGNTYISGKIENNGTVDTFDAPGNFNDKATFLARINCNGNIDWIQYFGSMDNSFGVTKFTMDKEKKNIHIITSVFDSLVIVGDTVIKMPFSDRRIRAILKYNTDGKRLEINAFKNTYGNNHMDNILTDESDNIYMSMYVDPPFPLTDSSEILPGKYVGFKKFYIFKFDKNMNYINHFDTKLNKAGNDYGF